jgi:NAD(P)-dependent dehydrogenase (short-subunit alcohol dehydrogenase family)
MTEDAGSRVAWVTGASRGMGANVAVQLAAAGFDVALTARDQTLLDGVAQEIRAHGRRALPHAADLTDRGSMQAFADAALAEFSRCDVLCNNGIYQGPGMRQLVVDLDLDELEVSFEADVVAPVLLCQRAITSMLAHGGGTILNMSSSSVFLEPPGTLEQNGWSLAYVAAKAGIDQLASILNVELGDRGIRAFTVEPGFVAYGERLEAMLEQFPGVPVSPPESIGPAVVWLVQSPAADRLLHKRVNLPGLTHKHGLLDTWSGTGTIWHGPQ